jgi:DNA-binding LacI/PurR family transcriptional regulator
MTMEARPGVSTVAMDNYAGGRMAAEHLLQQGRRQIAHLSGPLDWWEARRRQAGWRDALLAAGVPASQLHAEEGTWSSASGERAIGRLLASYPAMDAVFAGNDQMALSILQVACRRGIRVPDDLAVVGFDGLSEAAHYWPPLTTVYQDLQLLGSTAVQELIRAIDAYRLRPGTFEPSTMLLRPELIVRESSVALKSVTDHVPQSEIAAPSIEVG